MEGLKEEMKKIKIWFELYSCNYKINEECRKSGCKYMHRGECKSTLKWEHARKTPLNNLKRIIKKIKNIWNKMGRGTQKSIR